MSYTHITQPKDSYHIATCHCCGTAINTTAGTSFFRFSYQEAHNVPTSKADFCLSCIIQRLRQYETEARTRQLGRTKDGKIWRYKVEHCLAGNCQTCGKPSKEVAPQSIMYGRRDLPALSTWCLGCATGLLSHLERLVNKSRQEKGEPSVWALTDTSNR